MTLPSNPFTYEGHTFTGWNTAADGSGTPYADGASVTLTGNTTLYAQWDEESNYIPVNVTVVDPDSKITYSLWSSANPDASSVEDCVPVTNGLAHVGWSLYVRAVSRTESDAGYLYFYSDYVNGEGQQANSVGNVSFSGSTNAAWGFLGTLGNAPASVMLMVVEPVTLVLDDNGVSGGSVEQTVPYGIATPIMANPFTYEDHVFTGWNTEPDGSGTAYADGASVTLTEPLTLYAQWAADSVYCTVSLSLKDCIDINFYVRDIPTADAGRYTAMYTFKGKTTTVPLGEATPYSTDAMAGTSVYRFTVASCAASEMTEEVVFDVKIGETSALSNGAIHYSIQQYCDWVLDSSTETAKLKELCQAVLDYGTYAQVRFGSANAPANANHSRDVITGNNWSAADRAALAAFRESAYRSIPAQSEYPSWLARITCSLSLKSRTEMNFYYALEDGCSADTFAVNLTVDGEAWTGGYRMTLLKASDPNAGPDRVKVTILNIPASKLGSVIVLGLEDQTKGGSITLTYSPMTYAANEDAYTTGDQANVNVCRALYRYYKAAQAFFEQNN